MSTPLDPAQLAQQIPHWARSLGFADAAVAHLRLDDDLAHLRRWLDDGLHGGMDWMARNLELRARPAALHPGTVSVICARLDYRHDAVAAESILADGARAYISRYALGRDYHKLMRARLAKLAERIAAAIGPHGYRVFSDSAPALEKALARNAGLGWIGKNTLLLRRDAGSWFFLGEIFTDLALPESEAPATANLCGSCTACLDVCPTQAIIAPYRLDARRCISYLTIEHHGSIPVELRAAIGNRIFGCDDCQLVCPWNRYAKPTVEADFVPRHGLDAAALVDLFAWDEAQWRARTEGMALRRSGYSRWLRNLAVALGNAPRSEAVRDALLARRDDADELVREHVAWALTRQSGDA
ncbi:tRNA epoxyqueuosine(34) reductase QueG [Solimonas marina]|uniref:Epoxyqueuosine reductase n=1 Tax=Solimonas marina TaxID=2714601 RepID=A0A969WAB6_9GAMM|nr:tRNA epoxyqueuosine(34) reductase QueG [Solimonas marina]NKF23277.1 tRNA epoxyqueuosine(34) reductase QueG [Solimonas marina]